MSKMSELHRELSEQAYELGFESIEQAQENGYTIGYGKSGWHLEPDTNKAHEDWLKEKQELLARADEVWENPNYDDLLNLVSDLVKFIERGEV